MAPRSGGFNNSGQAMSPPGAMSQRTDMQPQGSMDLPNAGYGEAKAFSEIQAGAPMQGAASMPRLPSLFAPTERPDQPLTAGADIGPGPGSDVLPQDQAFTRDMQKIAEYLPAFERMAASDDAPETFRRFVRFVRGNA